MKRTVSDLLLQHKPMTDMLRKGKNPVKKGVPVHTILIMGKH